MLLTVTVVSFAVHCYAIVYMKSDPHLSLFMCRKRNTRSRVSFPEPARRRRAGDYLSAFTFSMLILVSGNNMLVMMLGWEAITKTVQIITSPLNIDDIDLITAPQAWMAKIQWLLSQVPIFKNPRTAKKVSGDAIFNNNYIFSFIVGTLLGDSYMERRGPSSRLKIRQSAIYGEYLLFIWKMLSDAGLCSSVQPQITSSLNNITGRTYYHLKFNTYSFEQFNWFHNYFYIPSSTVAITDPNYFKVSSTRSLYIKVIPLNIKEYLSPVALAYWIMDDGGITSSTLKLCTHWFS